MGYYYKRIISERALNEAENKTLQLERQLTSPSIQNIDKQLSAPVVDRTGSVPMVCDILTPIPPEASGPIDYVEMCDERSRELLAKSQDENLELRLSYSGGLDSTTALVGLLKFKDEYPGADIKVCMNQKSIDEYPLFYETYIKDKLDVYMGVPLRDEGLGENEAIGIVLSKDTGKDYFVVTGELGDQIFGAKIILESLECAALPHEEVFSPAMVTYIKPIVDKMPKAWGETNCGNVLAWLNFVMKWQWCELRMYVMFDIPWDKYHHFFATDKFQQWCLQTPLSVKFPNFDPYLYKLPTKEYIKSFNGDEVYYKTKRKVPSMNHTTYVFDNLRTDPTGGKSVWDSVDTDFVKKQINIPEPKVTTTVFTEHIEVGGTGTEILMEGIEIEL